MHRASAAVLLALSLIPASHAQTAAPPAPSAPPKIVIGPNILVSRDGDVPHVELHLAASPRTAKNLLGAAITATRPEGGWACRTYSSTDGGATWKYSEFPDHLEYGGADPQVAYTIQGTALFVTLTMNKSDKGKDCASLQIWRSEDGGKTWGPTIAIPCNPSWDHEQIVVDYTKGRYAGRIYLGVLYDYPVYRVGVFRSDDDGRTWIGPAEAANGGGTIGINDVTPMVLSDGTLVMPYGDFDFLPDKRKTTGYATSNLFTVLSTDGGVTFGAPQKAIVQTYNIDDKESPLGGFPKFAADSESKGKYRDRMYVAWEDAKAGGNYRIYFSSSSDRGRTWAPPKLLEAAIPAAARQWQPTVAVNKDGAVAVTWYDDRDFPDGKQYHHYIAVSVDGGATFLPTVRVSSAPSQREGAGNARLSPMTFVYEGQISLSFVSANSRWKSGGDYMGLAADKDGAFHPFWADARSGTFQIYTAAVRVEMPPPEPKAGAKAPAPPPPAPAAPRVETDLAEKVDFVFDPTSFDAATRELLIPTRLKNVGTQTIYGPIRVEFVGVGFPKYESEDDKKRNAENTPAIVGADNGKAGEGAVWEFDGAIAGAEGLEPGAVTNPVVLKLRLVDPQMTPSLRLKATGRVEGAK